MLLKRAYISNNKICYRNSANIATYSQKNCIYTDAVYTQMIKKISRISYVSNHEYI